jgi:F-type H+-transporting ATPase subunit alpha
MLKQPQYAPLPVEKEVAVLYALTRGHVDDVAVTDISRFEKEFMAYLDNEGKSVGEAILKERALTPEVEELLKKHIETFKKSFAA